MNRTDNDAKIIMELEQRIAELESKASDMSDLASEWETRYEVLDSALAEIETAFNTAKKTPELALIQEWARKARATNRR